MVKRHLKRHASPKTWNVDRKGETFIVKPRSGGQTLENSMGISTILKKLGFCDTTREVKTALNSREILVNGRVVLDFKYSVGFMDVLAVPTKKLYYRISIDNKGNLSIVEIDAKDANLLPCRVKTMRLIQGGKLQLNCHNGRNILQEKRDFKPNDTVLVNLELGQIIQRIPLKEGVHVLVTKGKQAGHIGVFEKIERGAALIKIDGHEHMSPIKYLFIIGEKEPVVKLR